MSKQAGAPGTAGAAAAAPSRPGSTAPAPPTPAPAGARAPANDAEAAAHKRSLALLGEDCRRVVQARLDVPFSNLKDAIDKLLPFHVFAHMDGGEADFEEATLDGARLLTSRHEAWQELHTRQVMEATHRLDLLRQRLLRVQEQYQQRRTGGLHLEEAWLIESMMTEESNRLLEAEKNKPQGFIGQDSDSEEAAADADAAEPGPSGSQQQGGAGGPGAAGGGQPSQPGAASVKQEPGAAGATGALGTGGVKVEGHG